MNKFLAIILVLCLALGLAACSKDNTTIDISQNTSAENQTSDSTEPSKPTEALEHIETNKPTTENSITEEQVRKIVQEEMAKLEKPSVDVNEITKNVLSALKKENEFIVGEQLSNLWDLPMAFPYGENTEVTVQEYTITKAKAFNPREKDDYVYEDLDDRYVFHRYQYKITVQGKADTQYAGKYIRIGFKVMNGSLSVETYFDGNLWEEGLMFSGGYNSKTNKTYMSGCVCKIQPDGTFKGEMVGYSDDNLDEFMITGVGDI